MLRLFPLEVLEVRVMARTEGISLLTGGWRQFNLYNVRPPIGELTDSGRSRTDAGQIENSKTVEGWFMIGHRFMALLIIGQAQDLALRLIDSCRATLVVALV